MACRAVFIEDAQLCIFETFCRIHQCISMRCHTLLCSSHLYFPFPLPPSPHPSFISYLHPYLPFSFPLPPSLFPPSLYLLFPPTHSVGHFFFPSNLIVSPSSAVLCKAKSIPPPKIIRTELRIMYILYSPVPLLYCTVLYSTVLYSAVLYSALIYCTVLTPGTLYPCMRLCMYSS